MNSRLSRALALGAVVVLMLVPQASFAAGDNVLTTLRPGLPGEPAWTVLKLHVAEANARLKWDIDAIDYRCPFAWEFVLFMGGEEPSTFTELSSLTLDYPRGHEGAYVYSSGALQVDHSTMWNDGAQECDSPGLGFSWTGIPAGTAYVLMYAANGAGVPSRGDATLSSPDGKTTIVGRSSGDRTFYLNMTDFGLGNPRAAWYSPGMCVAPRLGAENVYCDPCCWWTGGTAASADVGANRSAELTFERQPYFSFSTWSTASVNKASVTDPLGRTHSVKAGLDVQHMGVTATPGSAWYATDLPLAAHPAGTYRFDLEFHAEAHRGAAAWHVSGADYTFPT